MTLQDNEIEVSVNLLSSEIINILKFLIPGFISIRVIDSLTPNETKKEFDLIVNALIYTVIINTLVFMVSIVCSLVGDVFVVGVWDDTVALIWSVIISILLALIISFILKH